MGGTAASDDAAASSRGGNAPVDGARELRAGFVVALPLVPGTFVWAVAFGAAAAGVRMPAAGAVAMSVVAWSGTAQLAAVTMLAQPLAVIFLSSLLLSLRFVPMSLALGGLLPGTARWRRVLAACCMADASFALLATGRARTPLAMVGTWLAQWPAWVAGTAAGALAAPLLPARLLQASEGLVAVIFAVLAVDAAARGRREMMVAVAAGAGVAAAMLLLPGSVALPVAAVAASVVGGTLRR
jgi:predicted branched-subunit amino acid permease